MHQRVIDHDSHCRRHAYAVVRAERGATGFNPFSVDIGLNRIFEKIMLCVVVFFRHHIHV